MMIEIKQSGTTLICVFSQYLFTYYSTLQKTSSKVLYINTKKIMTKIKENTNIKQQG